MTDLVEQSQWDQVYQLETTDLVEGGANGIDNKQGQQLANRTKYLKDQLEAKTGQATEATAGIAALASQAEALAGTDDEKIMTAFKVKAVMDALVNAAPGALDTLNELAAALGDDPNFATTMANALAAKASLDHVDKYRQSTTVDFASDAQLDLTADASQEFGIILMTDTGGVLTAKQNVLMSSTQRDFVVYNNTAQTLTFKTSGGAGIDVPSNSFDLLRCDGTNITRQLMAPATQAQTDAGIDDTVAVTPKKMRWGFAYSFSTNSYIVFPTWLGGLVIQWGTCNMGNNSSLNFPMTFPNSCNAVFVQVVNQQPRFITVDTISVSGFTGYGWTDQGVVSGGEPSRWLAIGN